MASLRLAQGEGRTFDIAQVERAKGKVKQRGYYFSALCSVLSALSF